MNSKSEIGYGARIGNAEKLVAALQNYNGYEPVKPEYAVTAFNDQIATIKAQNMEVAAKKQTYSIAVENRRLIFDLNDASIGKLLSPINAAVKGLFGRNAKEATDVAAIIAKIRGANITKKQTLDPKEETVSQSYQSYSAKTQFFSDLIVNLTSFDPDYDPANDNLNIDKLNILYNKAVAANNNVMDAFTQLTQNNNTRINSYHELSQTALRIKDSIKAQYGSNSTEYSLIKGLKI